MSFKKLVIGTAVALMTTSVQPIQADCCDLCSDWSIYADWLYWKPRGCDLDFAAPYTGTDAIGNVSKIKPEYDNGVRIGITKGCDCLDFGIHYTYFRTDERSETWDSVNGNIAGTRIIPGYSLQAQGAIQYAIADWDLQYNVIDLIAGMKLEVADCLEARVFTGFKLAYIDQNFQNWYKGAVGSEGEDLIDGVQQKNEMDALGFTLGTSSKMEFADCFSFFGNFSYDMFMARTKRRFIYTTSGDLGATTSIRADLNDTCYKLISVVNLGFGVEYNLCNLFCCADAVLSFGYEYHYWINTSGFMNHQFVGNQFTFDRNSDTFSLDGFFLRLGINF